MKAILLLISCCLLSCASRKTDTSIKTEENRSKIEQNSFVDSNVKIKRRDLETSKKEVSKLNLTIKNNNPSINNSDCPQTDNVIYRDKEGNEALIPVSKDSEINLNSETSTDTKLKQTELELAAKIKETNNLIAENEELNKEKKKLSERTGLTFWQIVLIIGASAIGGIIIWGFVKKSLPGVFLKIKNFKSK